MLLSCKITKCCAVVLLVLVSSIFFVYCMTWYNSAEKKIPNKDSIDSITNDGTNLNSAEKKIPNKDSIDSVTNDGTNLKKHLPKAIIIGSNKSGTRALLVFLKIHPDIRACPDEVHFFDRDENYALGLEWYRQRMPRSTADQVTIEKTPAYFISMNVPERVLNMSKDVKLLVIVRDPTRRAISEYTQLAFKPNSSLPKFEDYVMKNHTVLNTNIGVVNSGVYIKFLHHWVKFFPLSQFHFVSGEQLVLNPAAEMRMVEKFLNLRPLITEKNFFFNKTKGFPCFIGKIGLDGKQKTGCLKGNKGRKHAPVRSDVLTLLHNFYQPYNQDLYKVVKRNFHWP